MRNNLWLTAFLGGVLWLNTPLFADDFNPSGVIVESLPSLSLNTLGTQSTTNPRLWAATPAQTLLDLTVQAGKASLTPAQRQLVVQLLSLDVTGTTFDDPDNLLGESAFLAERLRALFRQGEWETVLKLFESIPETELSEELLQIKTDTLLLKGDVKAACGSLAEKEASVETDKMRIACFVAQEEKDKAVLSYDIYQEKYEDTTSLFAALAENTLREIPTPLPAQVQVEPVDVYLVSLHKNASIDWQKQTRAVRTTVADLPVTDIPLRIELAEKSGLTLEEMKRIYRLPLFKPDFNNRAVKRAWLHQQISETTDESRKVAYLQELIALVKQDKLFVYLAPVITDILNTITPQSAYADIAFDAVQAYGLDNNLALAEPWFKILRKSDLSVHQKQVFLLTPLWQNMGGGYPYDLSEKMQKYCGRQPLKECRRLKQFIPAEMYRFELSNKEEVTPVFVSEADKSTRLGEALMRAVLNINANKELEKSYAVIRELAQPDKRNTLFREGMIFE